MIRTWIVEVIELTDEDVPLVEADTAETVFSRSHSVGGALINGDEVILTVGTGSSAVVGSARVAGNFENLC